MKFKVYNALNSKAAKQGSAYIRFHGKTGTCTISKEAAERLALKAANQVIVVQDEASPRDWYMAKTEEDGFVLRTMKDSGALAFNCTKIAQDVISSCKHEEVSIRCNVGGVQTIDGVEYLPIITAAAKKEVFENM